MQVQLLSSKPNGCEIEEGWGVYSDDGAELYSSASANTVMSRYGRQYLPALCIGGVSTRPEYRRLGCVRRIFDQVFSLAPERGWAVSLLHPFSFSYYRKFGYERIADCIVSRAPSNAPVVCDSSVEPMLLLFYLQYPAPAFVNTVVYTNAPSPWMHIGSFGRFIFDGSMENPSRDTVYILQGSDALTFRDFGFTVEYCTAELAVAWFE